MQLRRVSVSNVRSYESGHVDFPPGTTLLVGDVGAGKTSLLYAIEMALFGTAEVDAAYLVRHGAGHAEVAVAFEDDAHRYEVRRRFRRVRRKGRETFEPEKTAFTVDGGATEYSVTELRQRVIELLGFPDNPNPQAHSDLWRWAVYVPQERMRDILAAKVQDRLETVRKALGVERYRTAAENASELATDLRRSADARRREAELLRHFDEEFAEWSARGDALRAQRPARSAERDRARSALEGLRERLAGIDERVRAREADARELVGLEREQRESGERRAALARQREERDADLARSTAEAETAERSASELPALRASGVRLDAELAAARARSEQLAGEGRRLAESRAELSHLTQRRSQVEAERERVRAESERARDELRAALSEGPGREPPAPTPQTTVEIESALESARADEARSLAALARAEAASRELGELLEAGVCPTCHQSVRRDEFAAHRTESEDKVRRLEEARRSAGEQVRTIEERRRSRERYERSMERWREAERRRAEARDRLAGAEESERRGESALAEVASSLHSVETRVAGLAPIEAAERELRREVNELEARRQANSAELERAGRSAERAHAARAAADAARAELGRLDLEARAVETAATARATRLEALQRTLSDSQAIAGERSATSDAIRRAERDLTELDTELARLDARLDEAVRRVAAAETGRAERARLVSEADATARAAAWIGKPFREALLRMEQQLLQHAQHAFERNFARYFASLVDDPSLSARTDVAFTPAVTIDGEWTPAEALSGGERTSLALAFRLALAQVVRSLGGLKLDTLLLDEPTDGFSPEQVIRMGELLEELALPQAVLVSHEAQLAAVADRVVRVEKRDGRSVLLGGASARRSAETEP